MKPLSLASGLTASVLAVLAASVSAQSQDYPKRPVAIYVPYAPGGITDVLGRIVADQLSAQMPAPFVVENRPGGGTSVATVATIKAEPDGYTLLIAPNGTLAINPTLYKSLPYNPLDLKPLALIGSIPFALIVNPKLQVRSVQDLIKMARENPGKLNYGSGGAGTNGAIFMDMFESMTGTKMVHVPYRGSNPQLADTVAGQVQLGFVDANSAKQLVNAGKLRALAVSSTQRFEGLPDVPTLAEAGVPNFNAESWQMLVGPAKIPAATARLLNSKVNAIINMPAVRKRMSSLGVIPGGKRDLGELVKFVEAEAARWGDVIRKAGLAGTL
jgi:tripartite-type tricarboxylate transporter receptor subunit TctC